MDNQGKPLPLPKAAEVPDGVLPTEFAMFADHPEVSAARRKVREASSAVMRGERARKPNRIAMARLDQARRELRAVLTRLQQQRVGGSRVARLAGVAA